MKWMTVNYLHALGLAYTEQGRYIEAEQTLKRAIEWEIAARAHVPEVDMSNHALCLSELGRLYYTQARHAECESVLKRALPIAPQYMKPKIIQQLGTLYQADGRIDEAEQLLRWLVKHDEQTQGPERVRDGNIQRLGEFLSRQGRCAEAEALLKQALKLRRETYGPESPQVAETLSELAGVYSRQSRHAEAVPLLEQALADQEKALGTQSRFLHPILCRLGLVYLSMERFKQAGLIADRAIAISEHTGGSLRDRYNELTLRALVKWRSHGPNDAMPDLRRALDLAEDMRAEASGTSRERAAAFIEFGYVFEMMVDGQTQLGDPGEAFRAIERLPCPFPFGRTPNGRGRP